MEYNDKQVQIIQSAEKLFSERGFDGTSVRDIADTANVNLAMISYYFGSKEKLMEAMFNHRSRNSMLQLENIVQNTELEPMQKVELMIDQYIEKLMSNQCFHRVFVREQMVNKNEFITSQIHELKKKNLQLVRQLIQQGQKKGVFVTNIDIPLLMTTMTGTISQLITTEHYYREMNDLQTLSEEDYQKYVKKKLSEHLKRIFKAVLTHEV